VVEDEDSVRELARRTLSKQGYDVLEASSPEAALQLCESRREPIDLLLSDVIMPGMNGPSLGRKLKDLRPALKILFMSGYTDPGVLQNEIVGRGLPILFKPFRPEDLLTRVGKIIEG
jgi:CheY-like chemotaxis protein